MAALVASLAAFATYQVIGFPPDVLLGAVLVILYSVAVYAPRRTALITGAIVIPAMLLFVLVGAVFTDDVQARDLIPNAVVLIAIWVMGSAMRARRAQAEALESRAALLESERESKARLAVADERARIARELHDVVTHSVSLMVVQAGAARRVLETSPDQAKEALVTVESTGRQALVEMRRLLGVLRTEDDATGALEPQPGIDQLGTLLTGIRSAGLPVELVVEGEARPLPAGVDLSAYRIVQEALTNILKHAGPARAEVRLRYGSDALEVRVADDGRGGTGQPADAGKEPGHGLVGMRERVALFGGELRAGPGQSGGYAVTARLPV